MFFPGCVRNEPTLGQIFYSEFRQAMQYPELLQLVQRLYFGGIDRGSAPPADFGAEEEWSCDGVQGATGQ